MRRTLVSIVALGASCCSSPSVPAVVRAGGGCHQPGLDGQHVHRGPGDGRPHGRVQLRADDRPACRWARRSRFLNTPNGRAHRARPRTARGRAKPGAAAPNSRSRSRPRRRIRSPARSHPRHGRSHRRSASGSLDGAPGVGAAPVVATSPAPSSAAGSMAPVLPPNPAFGHRGPVLGADRDRRAGGSRGRGDRDIAARYVDLGPSSLPRRDYPLRPARMVRPRKALGYTPPRLSTLHTRYAVERHRPTLR